MVMNLFLVKMCSLSEGKMPGLKDIMHCNFRSCCWSEQEGKMVMLTFQGISQDWVTVVTTKDGKVFSSGWQEEVQDKNQCETCIMGKIGNGA
jgi:hypothetical protein